MLLMALFMPWVANAQETLTVYNGTDANQYIPMYGYYFDAFTKSECIIPATELTDMIGGAVSAITFYAKTVATTNSTWGTANQKVFLKEVSFTTLSGSFIGITDATIVFDGLLTMPSTSTDGYTITFSEDYTYNGGNLLIGVYNDTKGKYNKVEWYGIGDQAFGVSAYGNNSSSLESASYNAQSFLPKTTFTYTPAAAGGCAKPKNFNATGITAHEATLTWTAGGEESNWDVYVTTSETDVPDESTTPTYQVSECSKALTGLAIQTTYYAFVRSACGGDDGNSKWTKTIFATTREALAVDANNPYSQDFESNNDWELVNGALVNIWYWGSATNNGGEKSIYVSKDDGESNTYNVSNTAAVYASKLFNFSQGTYTFVFDWNAKGESTYDYLRVALAPGDIEFTAGTSLYSGIGTSTLPNGWIALDGGSKLNLSEGWNTQTAEASVSGTYTMVFIWRNDNSGGDQPPAAIDNISISYMTCPRPTNLTACNIVGRTATLSWTENGTATNWVLQYATNNGFSENLVETNVSGTPSKDLSGLSPETTYYARVKSVLGSEESSWSDVKDFTTIATCPKPTLSYVSYSATAFTGTVQWTGSSADAFEVAYRPTSDFDPSDMTLSDVTRVQLENVSEYTYTLENLTPETKYYIYIQADCGSEDGKSLWSNRVIFTTLETCLPPTGLSASTTSSTITLSWTAGAEGQDAWDIRYKKNTDSEYTYIHLDNHPTTSYTITGLDPVTTYGVNVRAYCSDTDQSKWGASTANQSYDLSVTTECAALTLPYTYGFEENLQTTSSYSSSNPFPKCWDRIAYQSGNYGSYTYYPYVFTATSSQPWAHGEGTSNSTSGHCLYFYQTSSSTNECAILPEISSEYEMNHLQIRFWGAVRSSQGTIKIGIMESPTNANTFTSIQEVNISNTYSNGFQEFTIPFSEYEGEGRYIAFMCGTGSTYAYFLIDDITVEVVPTCFVPTNLEATVNSATETVLTWTAGLSETDWELEVIAEGNSISQSIPVSGATTYTLSTTRATTYTVRVRANCGDGDYSDWSNPINFTSDCGVLTVDATHPFLEDFENVDASDFPPICWEKFNHEMSGYTYWYLNSNNGLSSSAAYSYWSEGYAFLVMPKMHINGVATLSFDYLIGSGTYDESCSVVVSTGEMTYNDFNQTIWTADGNNLPSGKASATASLSDFNGQDIYVAFKFKGMGTSGCTWYIDNVSVFVPASQISTLSQGWNWWTPTVSTDWDALHNALGNNLQTIKSKDGVVATGDALIPGQMYKIRVSADCELTVTGILSSDVSVTIAPGYNWFGYTGAGSLPIATALGSFTPANGDKIVSQNNGFAIFNGNEWEGTLTTLVSGQGYVYVSRATGSTTLVF